MAKRVTLKDLAEKLELSQNTISQILRGRPGFSDETRRLVLRTARDMGYISRKPEKKENICIVTPHNSGDTYYYTNFRSAIHESLEMEGFNLITVNNVSMTDLESIKSICIAHKIQGIVIVGDIGKELILQLIQINIPIVCAGFTLPGVMLNCVLEDDVSGVFIVLEELKKRGYTKIGYIGNLDDRGFFNRWMASKAFSEKKGLSWIEDAVFLDSNKGELYDSEALIDLLKNLEEKPEIFLCGNDLIAMAAIKAFTYLGYNVPKDIGVVGFDNADLAKLSIPTLATVDNYVERQADAISKKMIELIEDPTVPVQTILTPVDFVDGESIQKAIK